MKRLVWIPTAVLLFGLCPATASACVVTPFARVVDASDVIVEGRYFQDAANLESGHIEASRIERGKTRQRYEVRWSLEHLESPEGECSTQIPANGEFERFYLRSREDGRYEMIGRAWAKGPADPEETND